MDSIPDSFNYWTGPFGIRVSNMVKHVPQQDLRNQMYKSGGHTEMVWDFKNVVSEDKYKAMFTTLGSDGYYYFDPTKCNFTLSLGDKKISATFNQMNKISSVMEHVAEKFSLIPDTFVLTIGDTILNGDHTLGECKIDGEEIIVYVLSHRQ